MGLSRSRLFARAVSDFLRRQRQEQMLRRLNEVYASGLEPADKGLLKGIKSKVRRTVNERWRARSGTGKSTTGRSSRVKSIGSISGLRPSGAGWRHPCVVVQNDVFNRSAIATSVVCLITSNLSRANAPGNVLLKKGEANLPKASVVNVSQIITIDKAELSVLIGKLIDTATGAVRVGMYLLFDRLCSNCSRWCFAADIKWFVNAQRLW